MSEKTVQFGHYGQLLEFTSGADDPASFEDLGGCRVTIHSTDSLPGEELVEWALTCGGRLED